MAVNHRIWYLETKTDLMDSIVHKTVIGSVCRIVVQYAGGFPAPHVGSFVQSFNVYYQYDNEEQEVCPRYGISVNECSFYRAFRYGNELPPDELREMAKYTAEHPPSECGLRACQQLYCTVPMDIFHRPIESTSAAWVSCGSDPLYSTASTQTHAAISYALRHNPYTVIRHMNRSVAIQGFDQDTERLEVSVLLPVASTTMINVYVAGVELNGMSSGTIIETLEKRIPVPGCKGIDGRVVDEPPIIRSIVNPNRPSIVFSALGDFFLGNRSRRTGTFATEIVNLSSSYVPFKGIVKSIEKIKDREIALESIRPSVARDISTYLQITKKRDENNVKRSKEAIK